MFCVWCVGKSALILNPGEVIIIFDFTSVLTGTTSVIDGSLALVDPTTLIGGLVTVSIVSIVMVGAAKRVLRLVRR